MKKIAALLLIALSSVPALSAAEATSPYAVTVDFPFVSDYVFRGIQYAEESIQPSIELAVGDFYAGVWTSQAVTGDYENEFDFYLGTGVTLTESWALDVGATYYYYPETPGGDEQFEPFVGLTGDWGAGFSGSAYYFYETEFEASTFQFDLGYSLALDDATSVDLGANYGFVRAGGGGDYSYYGLSSTVNYALQETAGIYAGLVYADHDIGQGVADGHFYYIVGLSVTF